MVKKDNGYSYKEEKCRRNIAGLALCSMEPTTKYGDIVFNTESCELILIKAILYSATTRFIIPHMKKEKTTGINTTYVGYKAN